MNILMKRLLLFVSLLMLSAGFDIELTDEISIRPEYVCHAYHNHGGRYARRTYDDHIVYMTFIVKL